MTEKLLSERIEEDGITADAVMIGSAPYGRYEFAVTLRRPDGRELKMHDYSGPGEPTVLAAVGIMLTVAQRVNSADNYEEWASGFEMDPEKWQDRETYELQVAETRKLRAFLGEAFDAYLYETGMGD